MEAYIWTYLHAQGLVLVVADTPEQLQEALLDWLDDQLVHDFECCTNPARAAYVADVPCDCSLTKRLH